MDDFYLLKDQDLVVVETTNDVLDDNRIAKCVLIRRFFFESVSAQPMR